MYPGDCLWRARVQLRSKKVLSLFYSRDLEHFFNHILQIPHMNIYHVIDEFLNYQNDAEYLKELLMALSGTFTGSSQHKAKLQKLHNRMILPISRVVGGIEEKKVVAINNKQEAWFLVDISQHREAFSGKVWMASFSPADVLKLSVLMTSFGQIFSCSRPLLSEVVRENSEHEGKGRECSELATRLRSRSGFLACILYHENRRGEESKAKLKKLRDLRMYATPSIVTRMTIPGPPAIHGKPVRKKRVLLEDAHGTLEIYLRQDVARKQDFHLDVAREIASFLGITQAELVTIVQAVINADDVDEICETLERERISVEPEAHRVHAQLSGNGASVEMDAVESAVNLNGNDTDSRTLQLTENRSATTSDSSEESKSAAPLSNGTNRTLATRLVPRSLAPRQGFAPTDTTSRGSVQMQLHQRPSHQSTGRSSPEARQDGTSLDQYIRPNRAVNGNGTHQRRADDEYPGQAPSSGAGDIAVGQQGELLVYRRLRCVLGDQFILQQHWTSEFRHLLVPDISAWTSNDSRSFYADFMIVNAPATLLEYLDAESTTGTRVTDIRAESVNVYIEVKSTRGAATESLRLSDWQWAEAKRMDQALATVDATGEVDVFVVMRVSGVGSGNAEIKVIKDVWKRYSEGEAKLRTFGGVEVSGL